MSETPIDQLARSAPPAVAPAAGGGLVADALALVRYHIVLVAMAGTLVFGWLMSGERRWAIAGLVGFDWFLINLMNRATDIDEDLRNRIRGTARIAARRRLVETGCALAMAGSLVATPLLWPGLLPLRVVVHVIGLGYNYDIVPSRRGWTRFKEIYFLKNFGSAVLFVLTCFGYPDAVDPAARTLAAPAVWLLVLFFVPFELTYEILYDLRDLDGDRAAGIPTYPVVHGPDVARRIIDGLLLASAGALLVGAGSRWLGARELLLLVAPLPQRLFYRRCWGRGLTARDCILLTHLGTAQLLLYLVGTALWAYAGLPPNLFLPAP